jgi:EmrB/QacA subfamily drug resistance transporter
MSPANSTVRGAARPGSAAAPAVTVIPPDAARPGHPGSGSQRTGHHRQNRSGALTATGLIVVLVGVFLPMVDFFIVNVALPTIDSDLHASTPLLELVVSAYATAYALLLVVGGRLGDAFGRRRLFLLGMAAFTLTSLACGLAPSAPFLVGARVAQGASAALMVPQVLATIQAATSGERRARALGRYGAAGGLAAVVGQLVGGLLVSANLDGTGWRPIFLVNVPIGIAGLILAYQHVPDTRAERAARVDHHGTLLLGLTVLALLIPLTEGESLHWPAWTIALLVIAPLALAAFVAVEVRIERSGRTPLVPPSLLRHKSMRSGLILALPFFAGFGAFMFCYALLVQQGLHDSAVAAGAGLAPMAVTFLVASLSTSRLLRRYGSRVLTAGAVLQGVGLIGLAAAVLATWPGVSLFWLAPGMAVAGLGQGLVMSPLFGTVLSEVPTSSAGAASGVLTTTQQTALALGVATLGSLFIALAGNGVGMRDGFVTVVAIQVVIAIGLALGTRRLPGWHRRPAAELAGAGQATGAAQSGAAA